LVKVGTTISSNKDIDKSNNRANTYEDVENNTRDDDYKDDTENADAHDDDGEDELEDAEDEEALRKCHYMRFSLWHGRFPG